MQDGPSLDSEEEEDSDDLEEESDDSEDFEREGNTPTWSIDPGLKHLKAKWWHS